MAISVTTAAGRYTALQIDKNAVTHVRVLGEIIVARAQLLSSGGASHQDRLRQAVHEMEQHRTHTCGGVNLAKYVKSHMRPHYLP